MKTIQEIHKAYEKKTLSPVELTQQYLKQAKDNKLGAWVSVCEDRALKQAQAAENLLMNKGHVPHDFPLFGIPFGLKDLLNVEGVQTSAGSKVLENYVPSFSATSVRRLESAGAIILGKTNLDEFGMGSSSETSAFGKVSHPTHPGFVPGGSSGGSAAAVKADECFASLGTDTGGSIRLPAHFCGVVGLKPSYGRVSRYGMIAYASSLDQVGPLSHSAEDAGVILDAISGHDPKDSTSAPMPASDCRKALRFDVDWKKIRVGVPKEYLVDGLSPAIEKKLTETLSWLGSLGAKQVEISLPHTAYSVAAYYLIAMSEASSNLSRYDGLRYGTRPIEAKTKDLNGFYESARSLFGKEVKRRIMLGTFALGSGYYNAYYRKACQVRRLIQQDFQNVFNTVDFILAPVSPTPAFKQGEKLNDPLQMYLNDIFTVPSNLAGLPAISIPCGKDSQGLPVGLQWIGPLFQEAQLIQAGSFFQKEGLAV